MTFYFHRKVLVLSERNDRLKSTIVGVVAPEAAASFEDGAALGPVGSSTNPSHAILTAANVITFCRFALTIVFLILFVKHDPNTRMIALGCYSIAACTDFLDGQVARRTQTVSWLGKIMDPIMDRFLLITGVLGLMVTGELPVWVAVYVVLRDTYLAIAAVILRRYRTRPLDVIYIGKAATALLMAGFVDLLIALPMLPGLGIVDVSWLPGLNHEAAALGIYLVYAGILCSVIATVVYTKQGLEIRRSALNRQQER